MQPLLFEMFNGSIVGVCACVCVRFGARVFVVVSHTYAFRSNGMNETHIHMHVGSVQCIALLDLFNKTHTYTHCHTLLVCTKIQSIIYLYAHVNENSQHLMDGLVYNGLRICSCEANPMLSDGMT